jgi:hypothetical protein
MATLALAAGELERGSLAHRPWVMRITDDVGLLAPCAVGLPLGEEERCPWFRDAPLEDLVDEMKFALDARITAGERAANKRKRRHAAPDPAPRTSSARGRTLPEKNLPFAEQILLSVSSDREPLEGAESVGLRVFEDRHLVRDGRPLSSLPVRTGRRASEPASSSPERGRVRRRDKPPL